ncbi:MAG: aldehyde dehydrogenase family protein [Nitrospirales bacterium]|nr:aldehyde dehydrogenase family protein [Nitrospira sp.]MDR4500559.1 aldehyde dehydrogenase family protein [Nitrospirales bacterium]
MTTQSLETPKPFLIGSEWVHTPHVQPVLNPYTQQVFAHVCVAGQPEISSVLQSTTDAFSALKKVPAYARARALRQIADTLQRRREEFAKTICAEAGKPITDSGREVDRAIQTFLIASEESTRISGETIPMDRMPGMEAFSAVLQRFPIGPVLGITPFNFPLNLVAHKVAPCLAAGNPIVIKPAPQTPLTALLLGEVIRETDLPPGSMDVIPCDNQMAETLVLDDRFRAVSFTGSVAVGWMLKAKAGRKRVLLELGGNAGVIIEPDADIETAVQRCVVGGMGYSGQTCISVQRMYVQETIYEGVVGKLVERVRQVEVGDPGKTETVVGPLIDERAARRVEAWVQEAEKQGARVRTGGTRDGSVMHPTVLTDVDAKMKVSCEEVFGPVITVTPYQDFDDALALLNHSSYGLQAGIFTQNIQNMHRAYEHLDVGAVLINEIPTFRADHMPYGGVKDSGLGREGVKYAIQELTEPKLLIVNVPDRLEREQ